MHIGRLTINVSRETVIPVRSVYANCRSDGLIRNRQYWLILVSVKKLFCTPAGMDSCRSLRDPPIESPRRAHVWNRAICFVANARDSYGYHCALHLASHCYPRRPLPARLDQRVSSHRLNTKNLRATRFHQRILQCWSAMKPMPGLSLILASCDVGECLMS